MEIATVMRKIKVKQWKGFRFIWIFLQLWEYIEWQQAAARCI